LATLNNSAGVRRSSACFTSGSTGLGYGTNSANRDASAWTATVPTITSVSPPTGTRAFRLEKRIHPKTGDPMLQVTGNTRTRLINGKTPS
jgi:hypothetical protein